MCTLIRTGRNRVTHEDNNVLERIIPFLLGETHVTQAPPIPAAVERIGDCRICRDAFTSRGLICSADKHRICRTCVSGYVQQQLGVLEGGSLDKFRELTMNGGRIACAEPACQGVLPSDHMYNLIDFKVMVALYDWAGKAHKARRAGEGENL